MNMQAPEPALTETEALQAPSVKPTEETYDRLQQAYEHFNVALFGGTLPNALITLQRRKRSFGFFSGAKFANAEGIKADEIALNPTLYADWPLPEMLAGLVHDMVHLWQHHFGTPGRGRYHNREWAGKMKSIGLQPVDSGRESGKETGEALFQLIVAGGPFAQAAEQLIGQGFAIDWREVLPPPAPNAMGEGGDEPAKPDKAGKRVRYRCPHCDLKAWAKHDAQLMCGADMLPMAPE